MIFDNIHWLRDYIAADTNTNHTVPKQRGLDPVAEQTARQSVPVDHNLPSTLYRQEEV